MAMPLATIGFWDGNEGRGGEDITTNLIQIAIQNMFHKNADTSWSDLVIPACEEQFRGPVRGARAGSENVLSFAFEQHEPKQDQPQPQQSQKPQEQESKEEQIATKPKQIATKPEQIATKPKQIDSTPEKVLMSPAEQQKYVELAQSVITV